MRTQLVNFYAAIRDRKINIQLLNRLLEGTSFKSLRGYEKIINNMPDEDLQKEVLKISRTYEHHINYDTKGIFFLKIEKDHIDKFKLLLLDVVDIQDADYISFNSKYPLPLDNAELKAINIRKIVYMRTQRLINGRIKVSSCYAKYQIFQDEIPVELLGDTYKEYESIKGTRLDYSQSFDFIYFNEMTGDLQLHIDIKPKTSNADLIDFAQLHVQQLIKRFYSQHNVKLGIAKHNIFDRIEPLYIDKKEGVVKTLEHRTGTNSYKKETVSKGDDLRDELFHENGIKAISNNTCIYNIEINYIYNDHNVTLQIPGVRKTLSDEFINHIIIGSCINDEQVIFLTSKFI